MKKSAIVFEHDFDDSFVEELNSVRAARIIAAETMLSNLSATHSKLQERGLYTLEDLPSENEVAAQLRANIDELRSRLANIEKTVFADELVYYIDLIQRKSCIN